MDKRLINELKLKNLFINNNEECSICYNNFTHIKNIYMLEECNHIFCKTCIFKQMNIDKHKRHICCPLCRKENKNIKFNNIDNFNEELWGNSIWSMINNYIIGPERTNMPHQISTQVFFGMRTDYESRANYESYVQRINSDYDGDELAVFHPPENPEFNNYDTIIGDTPELLSTPQNQNTIHIIYPERDIELVISQAGCTREAAITALNNNNGDIVEAIMDLTV